MYFVGVTTHQSSIMKIFPRWVEYLQLGDVALQGINFPLHDQAANYRRLVRFLKEDPQSRGALVTTHKLDLFQACRELFDQLDEYAARLNEVSCLAKRDGQLVGYAKDPVTSGLALNAFLPAGYWEQTGAEALILGAGGSSLALTCYLLQPEHGRNRPARSVVTNRSRPRLESMRQLHRQLGVDLPIEYHQVAGLHETDRLMATLRPYSLVVNATGLGKDAPGSPVSDQAPWPEHGIAWDFNYRGELHFLRQARASQAARHLRVEDGWIYFVHGWLQVIAEVFQIAIPSQGPEFDALCRIAAAVRTSPA